MKLVLSVSSRVLSFSLYITLLRKGKRCFRKLQTTALSLPFLTPWLSAIWLDIFLKVSYRRDSTFSCILDTKVDRYSKAVLFSDHYAWGIGFYKLNFPQNTCQSHSNLQSLRFVSLQRIAHATGAKCPCCHHVRATEPAQTISNDPPKPITELQ